MWTGAYLGLIGALLHLVLVGRLYGVLRRAEGGSGWLAMTALIGALVQAAVLFSVDFTVSAAAFYRGRRGFDPEVIAAFFDVRQFAELILGGVAALFFAATAVIVLRMGGLPRWLGWFAAATTVALLLTRPLGPTDVSQPPHFLGAIWMLAASIVLIVRSERLSEGWKAVPQGTGECELMDTKVGGVAVHIGARIAAQARPGEVLVSRTVDDLVAGSGIEFDDRGEHALKGAPGEWRLFAVIRQDHPSIAGGVALTAQVSNGARGSGQTRGG